MFGLDKIKNDVILRYKMEICDNCGKIIKRTHMTICKCGNPDDGYYCSEKCEKKLFNKRYADDE